LQFIRAKALPFIPLAIEGHNVPEMMEAKEISEGSFFLFYWPAAHPMKPVDLGSPKSIFCAIFWIFSFFWS
jgi:hypothetical protein